MAVRTAHASPLRIEGGLFPADLIARLTAPGKAALDGADPKAYGKQDQAERNEAIQVAWTQVTGAWRRFEHALKTVDKGDPAISVTRERFLLPLFEALGYGRLPTAAARQVGERSFPISHRWMTVPIHLLGVAVDLDRRSSGVRGAAQTSPHGLVQEYLNLADDALWAILANGLSLRLLRDYSGLTRQAYLEFDLEAILTNDDYAAFTQLWLLCHSSRAAVADAKDTWWERWYQQTRQDGVRALDQLRDGVKAAIELLGSGFLAHPANGAVREALSSGALSLDVYYRTVLRLVYRLLFLFVAEDRDILLTDEGSHQERASARAIYAEHYSTQRLRHLADVVRGTQHCDLFRQLRLVMDGLGRDGLPQLALPPLGADFWGPQALGLLGSADLHNSDFLDAIRALAITQHGGSSHRVDYRNLGAAEFGSVYESLLELKPRSANASKFELADAAGNERKTSGSYYTPDSLVQCLLDSALDPLLQRAKAEKDPERALLDLKVCDPACGSGHFLVAAAHRIAKALAQVRSGDNEPAPLQVRRAMRDVVGRCIYGVDLNPMAVELCKVNLWLEAQVPDLPWTFLDAHIQEGNSLLGATPDLIAVGIPDVALDPLLGDDKQFCQQLKRENKARRERGRSMFDQQGKSALGRRGDALLKGYLQVDHLTDLNVAEVREKAKAYGEWAASEARRREQLVADAWCAAFVMHKTPAAPPPITEEPFARLRDQIGDLPPATAQEVRRIAGQFRFCHWWLKFPGVFGEGLAKRGFDLVIGNPPWDQVQLDPQEFFSVAAPAIANAQHMAARARMIADLAEKDAALFTQYEVAVRAIEGIQHFAHNSGLFPRTSLGRLNTAPLFLEMSSRAVADQGRVAMIAPSGIATDSFTQKFFNYLIDEERLASLFDFENAAGLFPGVHRSFKFCLLTLRGEKVKGPGEFSFFAHDPTDLASNERRFELTKPDFSLLNPNTRTCPVFRSRRDAELTKVIYRRVPVLVDENKGEAGDPWGFKGVLMFMMNTASSIFRMRKELEADGFQLQGNRFVKGQQVMLPLYEAKMIHHYDHRFGDYRDLPEDSKSTQLPDVPLDRLQDPSHEPLPRYWVPASEVDARLRKTDRQGNVELQWPHDWLLGWRDICRSTDERTVIASVIPRVAVGNKFPLMMMTPSSAPRAAWLVATLSSFAHDFAARQKIGGTAMNFFIYKQLPVLPPSVFEVAAPWAAGKTVGQWVEARSAELLVTSNAMLSFGRELGITNPFAFDPARRFQLRCELDAAFFHLYGLSRDDVDYVMDTFPIVRRHDEKEFGDYRTKLTILDLYDQMARR